MEVEAPSVRQELPWVAGAGVEIDAGLRLIAWWVVLGIAEELATCVAAAGGAVMASVVTLGISSLMPKA